jgi:hypothetical protein
MQLNNTAEITSDSFSSSMRSLDTESGVFSLRSLDTAVDFESSNEERDLDANNGLLSTEKEDKSDDFLVNGRAVRPAQIFLSATLSIRDS